MAMVTISVVRQWGAAALVVLMCFSSAAHSSETRVLSMGGTGFFISDYSNVMPFPATLAYYPNLTYAEMRVKNFEPTFSAGVHLPGWNGGVAGIYINRGLNSSIHPGIVIPDLSIVSNTNDFGLTHAMDFMYAVKMGGNQIGGRLSLGFDGSSQDSAFAGAFQNRDESARYIELAGGISNSQYDASIFIGLPRLKSEQGAQTNEWSGFGFGINARAFMGTRTLQYIPVISLTNLSSTLDLGGQETGEGRLNLALGGGILRRVGEDHMVILGIEAFSWSRSAFDTKNISEFKSSTLTMPGLYLGMETHPKSWLALRAGAAHTSQRTTATSQANGEAELKATNRESRFNLALGVGLHLGNFLLDLFMNEHFLFEGPDFISGQGSTTPGDLVSRVALSYQM